MSTPYSKVFDSFLSKVEDPKYLTMTQTEAETDMIKLLNSGIINFEYPKVDVFDKDDTNKVFNQSLGLKEIEIIANLMVLEWIERQTKSIYVLKQTMTDKDFRLTSQANHLQSLLSLKKDAKLDIDELKTKYSYSNQNNADYSGLAGD